MCECATLGFELGAASSSSKFPLKTLYQAPLGHNLPREAKLHNE